jgi:uncharacterized membrane protein YcaP (DUF421 family)
MFSIELTKIFEVLARVAIIYVGCFALLRIGGRRELSQLGPMDLLTMLLLSEAVSPALTGGDETITGGMIAAAVLIGLGVLTSWLSVRSRRMDALLEGRAKLLIRDGRVNASVMRDERITDEDLRAALHEHGLMNVGDVARAFVEAGGDITIIKRDDLDASRERFHAHAS